LIRLVGAPRICGPGAPNGSVAPTETGSYAFWRTIETLLGIAVASAISFLPKLLGEDEPARGGA
jgi:hypothetical protein